MEEESTKEEDDIVVKALYGLHQAPRAWYARLSTFLLKHNYRRGTIDKTLFIKKNSKDIILVQVYVDDIIFGSTNKAWCDEFEVLMKGEFEMSAMDRMIGSLMYLTASRPDIQFAVSACSRHQVTPLTSNLNAVKKIFKYLKGQPKLENQQLVDVNFLGRRLISCSAKSKPLWPELPSTKAEYVLFDANCCGQFLLVALLVPTGRTIPTGLVKYALTHDPIIYDSLVKQFWSTASLRASKEGPPAILATIDRTPYTITESLVRSKL
ncbi:putative ribonuclease H-like domain-containing protein [Tanacetum coccineum]